MTSKAWSRQRESVYKQSLVCHAVSKHAFVSLLFLFTPSLLTLDQSLNASLLRALRFATPALAPLTKLVFARLRNEEKNWFPFRIHISPINCIVSSPSLDTSLQFYNKNMSSSIPPVARLNQGLSLVIDHVGVFLSLSQVASNIAAIEFYSFFWLSAFFVGRSSAV